MFKIQSFKLAIFKSIKEILFYLKRDLIAINTT